MSLPLYRVWHDRPNCIACGACAAATPENWVMNPEDGLADCVSTTITDAERAANDEAALVCPVNIIHVAPEGEVPAYFQALGVTDPGAVPSGKRDA
jgi:ferredoxin